MLKEASEGRHEESEDDDSYVDGDDVSQQESSDPFTRVFGFPEPAPHVVEHPVLVVMVVGRSLREDRIVEGVFHGVAWAALAR